MGGMFYLDVDKLVIEDLTGARTYLPGRHLYACGADVLAMPHTALLRAAGCLVCGCSEFEREDEGDK